MTEWADNEAVQFAEVIVFSPAQASVSGKVARAFTYQLPDELRDCLKIGSLVVVPFGRQRIYGVIVAFSDRSPVAETRPIEALADPDPVLTLPHLELAHWMSREYLALLHECLEIMLPPGMIGHVDVLVSLAAEASAGHANTEAQSALLELLWRRGSLRGAQLDQALPRKEWRSASEQLARRNIVTRESFLAAPRAHPKQVRTVYLIPDTDEKTALSGLTSKFYPPILELLRAEEGPMGVSQVYDATGCNTYHLNKLAERNLIAFGAQEVWRDPLADHVFVPTTPPPLTPDQAAVWEEIKAGMGNGRNESGKDGEDAPLVHLLHGVTGSGKTEIYLRAVAEALAQGQQALILVPEISLTPQTVTRFAARFPDRVAVLHSALTEGERYDTWRRARAGLVDVVIGPRSALFAPLSPLGLIVLDEEHDASYKQEAPRPRYHAREAALELARQTDATVILGSATPSLESYRRAQRGEFNLLKMPRRIMGHTRRLQDLQSHYRIPHIRYRAVQDDPGEASYIPLPPVQIVDLRAELRAGNRSILSRALQRGISEVLSRGEQVILFLNRRGSATFVICRDCGHVIRCPRCDVPLTYHGRRSKLICHHCNHREAQPSRCPRCGGKRIRYFGLGTERVEAVVQERWPDARLMRWDRDTARTHTAHADILQRFVDGAADVMIGTQMIAKGLDLPLVTLVGVISADTALNLPDFRSGERTFQVLTQVAGRAGRGLLGGRVIIQTYHPTHYAVVAASKHAYETFAAEELAFRREQGYPPHRRLVKLIYADANPTRVRSQAEALAENLREALVERDFSTSDLIGPAPAFFARLRGRYRWQILLRLSDPVNFLRGVKIPSGWRVDVDPVSVL